MSQMSGTPIRFLMSVRTRASSGLGTVTRTSSHPASSNRLICATVASTSNGSGGGLAVELVGAGHRLVAAGGAPGDDLGADAGLAGLVSGRGRVVAQRSEGGQVARLGHLNRAHIGFFIHLTRRQPGARCRDTRA